MTVLTDNSGASPLCGTRLCASEATNVEDLSKSFEAILDALGEEAGGTFQAIRATLDRGFVRWAALRSPDLTRPALRCGMLVRVLLEAGPIVAFEPGAGSATAPLGPPARFWPDGLAAFHYALDLYSALRAPARLVRSPRALELPLWWSIRENLAEEPSLATPFLELLAGEQPTWQYWAATAIGAA